MELSFRGAHDRRFLRTPTHIYLLPHPILRPMVAHYTLCLAGPVTPHGTALTLIPDASGCLVFDLGPGGLKGRMYGPTTQTVTVQNDLGQCPFRFFVECRPGGLYGLTGLPQWELADRVWPLADTAPALERAVAEAFYSSRDLDRFITAMDALLLSRPVFANPAAPLLARMAAGALEPGESGYSPRHLSRLFREGAGMGHKAFLRVLRVNAAVRRLSEGVPSLTALAQELGYYDQSHFIHDFRSVCGLTPGTYTGRLEDFYNEPLKL